MDATKAHLGSKGVPSLAKKVCVLFEERGYYSRAFKKHEDAQINYFGFPGVSCVAAKLIGGRQG